ncbi:MAG: hypothetical protein FJW86_09240 [Actinobacteria bacterium]|nr:hypothetical protein [Actinomycetota bacterium]
MTRFRRRVVALVLVVTGIVAAVRAGAYVSERRLPPPDREDLARIFDPKVEDMGFEVTRARLQNLDSYAIDPKGRHLAIYLEPTGDTFTDEEYVAAFADSARVFLPLVYKKWKGLKSFDVCLEPLPSVDASEEPPAVTQIFVTRKGLNAVDWDTVTLTDLIATANEYGATNETQGDFYVYFLERLNTVPELVAARAEAEQA